MESMEIAHVGTAALRTGLSIAGPLLLAGMVAGILFGLLQAMTQIHEATLTIIPKMAAVVGALVIAGPWILQTLTEFMTGLYRQIPYVIR